MIFDFIVTMITRKKICLLGLMLFIGFDAPSYALDHNTLFQLQLTKDERDYLHKKKKLTVCVDPDWMPYEKIENGKHVGMAAEFIHLISKQLGIPISLVPTSTWNESLQAGKQRRCDFFSLVMATPEREKFLNFSKTFFSFPLVIATRYEHAFITDIRDVTDKKLGIQMGYAYAELLRLEFPSINLIEVESLDAGLSMVVNNELFGMIGSLPSVAYAFQKNTISRLMISGKLAQLWDLGLGARNDEPLLVDIFDKAIGQINDRELQKITNQWMTIKYEEEPENFAHIQIFSALTICFLFFLYHHVQLKKYNKLLKYLSITDKLTGASNRLLLDQQLDSNLHLAERYHQQFSVILLDIDYFKKINDQHGHLVGDYALKTIVQLLKDNIRSVDILGRWGGEEFLIICPEQTVEGAGLLAEKLRKVVNSYIFQYFSSLSCSFGISTYKGNDDSRQIIARADNALYMAKAQGRNQVCIS